MALLNRLKFWKRTTPRVAVIRLVGVIGGQTGGLRRGLNFDSVAPLLKKAFNVSRIRAVVLVINSPGGSPVQSQLIAARIRQLSKEKDVPVLSFCEDVAASGGYWLAAAADEIYASEASVIGSIGVISAGFGFPELLEKIGVERRVYTSGKSKSMLDPFRPEKPEDVEYLKSLQNDIHQQFIDYVRTRRGTRLSEDEAELFSGRFWTGRHALKLGLIDNTGLLHDVLETRFGKEVEQVAISQKRSFLPFGGGMAESLMDHFLARLEARGLWQRFGL
jgi:signal peptide peptidase SppA